MGFGTARVRVGSCVVVWVMGLGGCFVGAWKGLGGGWWLVCVEDCWWLVCVED